MLIELKNGGFDVVSGFVGEGKHLEAAKKACELFG